MSIKLEQPGLLDKWENIVECNLGINETLPLSLDELIDDQAFFRELLALKLAFPQTNGTVELRERIAALYTNTSPENILVTIGASQAIFTTMLTILQQGDEIILMPPTYMKPNKVAATFGFSSRCVMRLEELGWGIDVDGLKHAVSKKTRMIYVCNPNNPTGQIMSASEMEAVIDAADSVGAWILADEIFTGTERTTEEITPTFWGKYSKVIVVSSLSKMDGLPGLRIGWVVAPKEITDALWCNQGYNTISSAMISNQVAAYALQPEVRSRLITRSRGLIHSGYQIVKAWAEQPQDFVSHVPPQATSSAFVRYHQSIPSYELAERLIKEKSTLVMPGTAFGLDQHMRIGFSIPEDVLREGLNRIIQVLSE
jgi:aspartate/methionine/tyrosine aminotransferase